MVEGGEKLSKSGGVEKCWERSRECEKVWGEGKCGV